MHPLQGKAPQVWRGGEKWDARVAKYSIGSFIRAFTVDRVAEVAPEHPDRGCLRSLRAL